MKLILSIKGIILKHTDALKGELVYIILINSYNRKMKDIEKSYTKNILTKLPIRKDLIIYESF